MNEIICLGAGGGIPRRSSRVDPQWLTVMLPVRQAHAMRLSSWRQINSPIPTLLPTANLFLLMYPSLPRVLPLLTASDGISSRPSRRPLSGICYTVLDRTPLPPPFTLLTDSHLVRSAQIIPPEAPFHFEGNISPSCKEWPTSVKCHQIRYIQMAKCMQPGKSYTTIHCFIYIRIVIKAPCVSFHWI